MNFEIIRIAVALIGTSYLAYEDYKTSFMNDKVLYSLLAIGVILDIAPLNWDFAVYCIVPAVLILAVGYVAYISGQLGAGDVFLFSALQLLLPFRPSLLSYGAEVNVPFIISVFLASSFYALIFSAVYYAYKLRNKKLKFERKTIIPAFLLLVIFCILFPLINFGARQIVFMSVLFASGIFLTITKKQITEEVVVQYLRPSEIEEEDILCAEKMDAKILKKYNIHRVLTKKEIAKLKKIKKMRKFPVMKNLPRIGPAILLGLISCLLVGDMFIYLLFY